MKRTLLWIGLLGLVGTTPLIAAGPARAEAPKAQAAKAPDAAQKPAAPQAQAAAPAKPTAQPAANGNGNGNGEELGMFAKFTKVMNDGGIFMWFILITFGFGLVIIVERVVALYGRYNVDADAFFEEIRQKVLKGDVKGAIALCDEKPNAALPQVLKAALLNAGKPERVIQDAVDEADLTVLPKLQARTPYLSMIANVATLMGLLGTILGLIAAFAGLAHADPSQKQAVLAQGIAIAMNTTAFGLIVAIPCMVSHALLSGRTNTMIQKIDEYSVKLINLLIALQQKQAA